MSALAVNYRYSEQCQSPEENAGATPLRDMCHDSSLVFLLKMLKRFDTASRR
jgi:hypothetical protein